MVQATEEVQIDTNLYSRQIGTFGLETMGKLIKMKVLIVGQRGLGVEVAKNLILAGPGQVDIFDPTMAKVEDLGSNFYLKADDVGKNTRAAAGIGQLKELNPYVDVRVIDTFNPESAEEVGRYNVICLTENFWGLEKMTALNEAARSQRVGFLLAETLGAAGFVFSDFGKEHIITDANGEQTKSFIVTSISKDTQGTVVVHEDKRHSYQDGDYVKFVEVEGMTELNNRDPIEISVNGPFSFKLKLDTTGFSDYTGQGVVEDVKVPKKQAYHSLQESIKNPPASAEFGCLEPTNMNHFGMQRSEQLHMGIRGVYQFQSTKGRYPDNTEEDLAEVVKLAKEINAEAAGKDCCMSLEEVDETIVRNVAAYSKCSISPMCAFLGGMVAQEIVKFTGKYSPLRQWMHFDTFESLPEGEVDRRPMECRYDDQIKIYGREVQEKLGNIKTFMIGAGALGCEYAKAFAMMGLGCGPDGLVTVTDNDNIEVSNLNRQFLFRKNNVGKPKSKTACEIAQQMNPDLKINPHTDLVSPDTEDIFTDEFWDGLNFIVNAVDNIKARLYVDSRCAWYGKGLLESGTLGTKANQQMIVPRVTQVYGDSQDPPEESIPLCTLRSFPNLIEHCIEWGRDIFEKLFTNRVMDAVDLLKDQEAWLQNARQSETSSGVLEKLTAVKEIVNIRANASMLLCAQEARKYFEGLYDHGIRDLKALLPDDHKDSSGNPFWSGPKRSPQVVTFDPEDPLHFSFAYNAANLVAVSIGLEPVRDEAAFKEILLQTKANEYVQKAVSVETPEEAKQREAEGRPAPQAPAGENDEALITELLNGLKISTGAVKSDDILPAEFEKDDDQNFHIDFITACSNLRARNYRITEADRNKTKMIAGKIIPAIATTTAMVTGSVGTEIYKYVQGLTSIDKFKNVFINLALPTVMFTEPDGVKKNMSKEFDVIYGGPITMIPEGFTVFDKVDLNEGSMTVQQLMDWFAQKYEVELYMISCGKIVIYNLYQPGNRHASRVSRKVEDIYQEIDEKQVPACRKYLTLEVMGTINATGADFQMPPIKYTFRQ